MPTKLRALRGATTLDEDTFEQICERVGELMTALLEKNQIQTQDIVTIFFTATSDIHSGYPAAAARKTLKSLNEVALLGSQEIDVESGTPLCIRVLIQFYGDTAELKNLYLRDASSLRQ